MEYRMPRRYVYPLIGLFAAIVIITGLSVAGLMPADEPAAPINVHSLFLTENDYLDFISGEVRFDGIDLRVVGIRKGDNFWKIARDNGVNIDTLIGANPHWDTLTARLNQRIVVPSKVGVLNFITDPSEIEEIAELYGVERSRIRVQDLPPLYWAFSRFKSEKKPAAVFVEGARPITHTMTPDMARKYALREMFRSPLAGRFSSHFGGRVHPIFRQYGFHNGVDIATAHGTAVGASCGGTVVAAGWMGGYGKAVVIDHPRGYRTLYGHLSSIHVRPGQRVAAGRIIGRVGSTGWATGPPLHFTLWHNGRLINPLQVLW
jgi:murein DD-endopeptidase MepM/ murein hydrolase activator NlpD